MPGRGSKIQDAIEIAAAFSRRDPAPEERNRFAARCLSGVFKAGTLERCFNIALHPSAPNPSQNPPCLAEYI
jgi:hypothetical protein